MSACIGSLPIHGLMERRSAWRSERCLRAGRTTMWNSSIAILGSLSACLLATPVLAIERAEVVRDDDAHVRVTWVDNHPAAIFVLAPVSSMRTTSVPAIQ